MPFKSHKYNNFYGEYKIGNGTRIGSYCDIAGEIGKNCIIQSCVFIPKGITIKDNVFIGPGVIFANDKHPPSNNLSETLVEKGAVIGAGAVILPGIIIGEGSVVGAGAVVTKSVPRLTTVVGNPAKKMYV